MPLPAPPEAVGVNAYGEVPLRLSPRAPRSARPREVWRDYLLQGPVWLVVAILHVLFVLVLWRQMRPPVLPAPAPVAQHDSLQVRFFSLSTPAVLAPPPALTPPPPLPKLVVRHVPPAPDAMRLQPPPASPPASRAPSPGLFDAQGRILLPSALIATPKAEPGYVANLPQGDARVMHNTDPVKYKATRFEQYFPPPGETLGQSAVRHVVQTVSGVTEVNLPRGVHLKCQTLLGVPIPNCTMPPAPPSAKDDDERLSMAPATSLDGARHGSKAPSVQACIDMYRAGKPLAWGCPIDTPRRAVDAELRVHHAGATGGH